MTLTLELPENTLDYQQSKAVHENETWNILSRYTIAEACGHWLETLSGHTKKSYGEGFKKLVDYGLICPTVSLQDFAIKINHQAIVDAIKQIADWSEATKQNRAAGYISFTGFLSRQTDGMIRKAIPSRQKATKTFFRISDKVKTDAMTQQQWLRFFEELYENPRDCLIAKLLLQGAKRVEEVLSIRTTQINWTDFEITFQQSKNGLTEKETVITYSPTIFYQLADYLKDRTGLVFVTRTGNRVYLNQLAESFSRAGKRAGIPFKVTPHVLRASAVTYFKGQGFQDSDIMKITGHASAEMVHAYDKSERAENATKKVNLIT
jgi:integrase/recombinase XerD